MASVGGVWVTTSPPRKLGTSPERGGMGVRRGRVTGHGDLIRPRFARPPSPEGKARGRGTTSPPRKLGTSPERGGKRGAREMRRRGDALIARMGMGRRAMGHRPYGCAGSCRRDAVYGVRGSLTGPPLPALRATFPSRGRQLARNSRDFLITIW